MQTFAPILLFLLGTTSFCYSQNLGITQTQFNQAVTSNGYPTPSAAQYNAFVASLSKASITGKLEAAMYLAQLIHESGGLIKKREVPCTGANGGSGCPAHYADPNHAYNKPCGAISGRSFYGRGYIQLTWCDNYIRASQALGLGETLKNDPDSVASNEGRAWDVSAWYWNTRVHGPLGGTAEFGRTTKAINGMECPSNPTLARARFAKYEKVFAAFQVGGTPNERGCYN